MKKKTTTLNKRGMEGNFPNMTKRIYEKPTASVILNSERLKASPLRSGKRPRCLLLPFPFNTVLEDLARSIRQEN